MAKLTIEDLKDIKDRVSKETSLRHGKSSIKVTVHMGTCGIAAGARDVMNALMVEMGESNRDDIRVMASGCIGMCSSEPNVTVEIQEKEPIVYKEMDANKMRQVFKRHVMMGEVQTGFALGKA
jgi:NADP-reducing hydrogenase subunit HndB